MDVFAPPPYFKSCLFRYLETAINPRIRATSIQGGWRFYCTYVGYQVTKVTRLLSYQPKFKVTSYQVTKVSRLPSDQPRFPGYQLPGYRVTNQDFQVTSYQGFQVTELHKCTCYIITELLTSYGNRLPNYYKGYQVTQVTRVLSYQEASRLHEQPWQSRSRWPRLIGYLG